MDRDHGRRLEAGAAAVLSADYQQAVQLLLRLVPTVFSTDAFALKGGTAINLFLSPVSRLSGWARYVFYTLTVLMLVCDIYIYNIYNICLYIVSG